MTTKEDFEKWYATKWKLDKECPSFDIWQACDELNKAELARLELENKTLREAGQAVITRWDSPKWKETEHTAVSIERLRQALSTPTTTEHLDAYCESRKDK